MVRREANLIIEKYVVEEEIVPVNQPEVEEEQEVEKRVMEQEPEFVKEKEVEEQSNDTENDTR